LHRFSPICFVVTGFALGLATSVIILKILDLSGLTKDILLTFLPSLGTAAGAVVRNWSKFISLIAKARYFLSSQPIYWEVIGVYESRNFASVQRLLSSIKEYVKSNKDYSTFRFYIDNPQKLVFNVEGVSCDIVISTHEDGTPLENKSIEINVSFSARGPIKTFIRKDIEKLINPLFILLDKCCKPVKFEVNANIKPIPVEILELKEQILVKFYKMKVEDKDATVVYTYSTKPAEKKIKCISPSWQKCLSAFHRHALI